MKYKRKSDGLVVDMERNGLGYKYMYRFVSGKSNGKDRYATVTGFVDPDHLKLDWDEMKDEYM
jgi:hypothetical protein